MSQGIAALLRFHAMSGTRLALRASVPLTGVFVVAVGLSQYPGATLARLAENIAAATPDLLIVVCATALAVSTAAWAVPRVMAGSGGWIRSLPAGAVAHRRALAAGVAAALAPVILLGFAAVAGVGLASGRWNAARWASLIPFSIGAAYAVLPLRRRIIVSPLGVLGAAIAIGGGWDHVVAGMLLVAGSDALAGAPVGAPSRRAPLVSTAWWLPWRIALRALRGAAIGAWIAGSIPLVAGALFLARNDLPAQLAARAARLSIAAALVVTLASLADRLALHRPAWPWARSLPWTSRRRVGDDAIVLAAVAGPVLVAGLFVDPLAALAAVTATPLAALRASAAMRHEPPGSRAAGAILLEEGIGALAFALVPWVCLAFAAATPRALRSAAEREAACKVSRWTALQHLSSGDSGSWSGL